jgi:hypothetical protein
LNFFSFARAGDIGRTCRRCGGILKLSVWPEICSCTDSKTKSYALLDELLTESVPEIDVAVECVGTFDEVCVEMFIDETTPLTGDLAGRKETLNSTALT